MRLMLLEEESLPRLQYLIALEDLQYVVYKQLAGLRVIVLGSDEISITQAQQQYRTPPTGDLWQNLQVLLYGTIIESLMRYSLKGKEVALAFLGNQRQLIQYIWDPSSDYLRASGPHRLGILANKTTSKALYTIQHRIIEHCGEEEQTLTDLNLISRTFRNLEDAFIKNYEAVKALERIRL